MLEVLRTAQDSLDEEERSANLIETQSDNILVLLSLGLKDDHVCCHLVRPYSFNIALDQLVER